MKRTIKIALIILAIITILFILTGCGKEEKVIEQNNNITNEQIAEKPKAEFSLGEWKDNTYENNFLGLKFDLPQEWSRFSDEQIEEMLDLGQELLNDDQKKLAEVSKLTSVYYMTANNPNTGDNVSIVSEKPVMEVTTEFYINKLKTELTTVSSINYEIVGTSKEKVADIECDVLTTKAKASGIEMIQKYYVYKVDNYVIAIIGTSTNGEDSINDIMKCFK